MKVGQLPSDLLTHSAARSATGPRDWFIGQRLQATVLHSHAPRTATLAVEGQLLEAHSSVALRPGQRLTLSVEAGGPLPLLKLIGSMDFDPVAEVHARALRLALPRQGPITPLLEQVVLLGAGKHIIGALPPTVSRRILELQQAVPDYRGLLYASGLRAAIVNSGLLLEAKLAKDMQVPRGGTDAHQPDFKAGLLRLLAELDQFLKTAKDTPQEGRRLPREPAQPAGVHAQAESQPPSVWRLMRDMRGQAEGALYRIVTAQLRSVCTEAQAWPVWHLELPFFDAQQGGGVVVLELERRRKTRGNRREVWSVALDCELAELGSLQARLSLCGKQLTARLWASRAATVDLLNQHLGELRDELAQAGLTVGAVDCVHGTAGKKADNANASYPLVELQA